MRSPAHGALFTRSGRAGCFRGGRSPAGGKFFPGCISEMEGFHSLRSVLNTFVLNNFVLNNKDGPLNSSAQKCYPQELGNLQELPLEQFPYQVWTTRE
jgi:hypothetical protein